MKNEKELGPVKVVKIIKCDNGERVLRTSSFVNIIEFGCKGYKPKVGDVIELLEDNTIIKVGR